MKSIIKSKYIKIGWRQQKISKKNKNFNKNKKNIMLNIKSFWKTIVKLSWKNQNKKV